MAKWPPAIEPAESHDVEHDEFDPMEIDASSLDASTSITSSIYRYSYENGRRVSTGQQTAALTFIGSNQVNLDSVPDVDISIIHTRTPGTRSQTMISSRTAKT